MATGTDGAESRYKFLLLPGFEARTSRCAVQHAKLWYTHGTVTRISKTFSWPTMNYDVQA